MADLATLAAAFGDELRRVGIAVSPERIAHFVEAIALALPATTDALFWLGRVTLLTGAEQYPGYANAFDRVFRGILGTAGMAASAPDDPLIAGANSGADPALRADGDSDAPARTAAGSAADLGHRDDEHEGDDEDAPTSVLAAMSVTERLAQRSFADLDEDELALIRRLVAALPLAAPMRRGLRAQRARRGPRMDVRASLRQAYRTAGDPITLVNRRRRERPRRIVLIADVSGSMAPYARVYLHLLRGAALGAHAETFVFATRLTRLTRLLTMSDPDDAYRKVADAAPDWSSGTRIGRALMQFIDVHGRRGLARGSVIVIVSDGWETEDPALVALAMERLGRLAYRIIWVNPRKAAVDYAPLAGGMAAALPFVDTFLSGHSVHALTEVVGAIGESGSRRTPRDSTAHCLG